MPKLILSMDGLVLKEIPLTKERTRIGRKPHNDIQIDNLAISGEHAVIVNIHNDSFLEDLDSTNGTFVNGQQIKKHFLQNNDVIELGKYRLKYVSEQGAAAAQDFEKTMVLRPGTMHQSVIEQAAGKSFGDSRGGQQAEALPPAVIQILSGPSAGRELELVKTLTTLGKPGVQVAAITRRPHGYFIAHVEGSRFPVLNGNILDAQAHELHDHDVIELAGVKMEFFFRT
jgi:hypothetical protein